MRILLHGQELASKNQLNKAMIEATRLAKPALRVCASRRQAIPFYLLIEQKQFSAESSEVLTQNIDQSRAGMKSNQNKRRRRENVNTTWLVIFSCPVEHNNEGLIKYILLRYHHQVQQFYDCAQKDLSNYEPAVANKFSLQYTSKGQK